MSSSSIKNQPDFVLGSLYVLAGSGFSATALNYEIGTLSYMGSGYFPLLLGILLTGIGLVIVGRSVWPRGPCIKMAKWHFQSLFWMVGSIMIFGLALQPLGLIIALILLVVLASLASHEFTWKATLANAVVMVVVNVGGFAYGLSIPFPIFPSIINFNV